MSRLKGRYVARVCFDIDITSPPEWLKAGLTVETVTDELQKTLQENYDFDGVTVMVVPFFLGIREVKG